VDKRLFVGSLPYNTTEDDLRQLFEQAGTVEDATIINDRDTGRSKGFGFVQMANDEDAAKAIEMFNNYEMSGRQLKVNEARPREERGGGGGGYGGGGGSVEAAGGGRWWRWLRRRWRRLRWRRWRYGGGGVAVAVVAAVVRGNRRGV
jgi:RNA recognition motif-containing protein